MNRILQQIYWLHILIFTVSCSNDSTQKIHPPAGASPSKGTYAYDLAFLKGQNESVIELYNDDSTAKVLLSPAWQGRVMTSTATGDSGTSFGWINYDLLSSKEKKTQFNPVGGEERFWIGPEGGQYSFYFKKGDSFNISTWQVPAIIDTIAYQVMESNRSQAVFAGKATISNYSGNSFDFAIERKVILLNREVLAQQLGVTVDKDIQSVAYETVNKITNTGDADWAREKGLLSIWLLGMFTPTPQTVVIIPFQPLANASSFISDNYFGSIPSERLQVKDSVLYFTCDGKYRSKIGLSPMIAKPIAASYDFAKNVLTLVLPEVHRDAPYVNSKWEIQSDPYKGDVINSYNDGPLAEGGQLGPFYEIESSSPALELKKGMSGSYRQVTCHLQADYLTLKKFTLELLKVNLDECKR
ncbi:MAG: hypothetical protein H7122_09070 [Chitinophagaceae bacterium]|nr:hypothetical protein [Chitinophagaceae bacterium]